MSDKSLVYNGVHLHIFSYGLYDTLWFWGIEPETFDEIFNEAITKLRYLDSHPDDEIFADAKPIDADEPRRYEFWIKRDHENVMLAKTIQNDTPERIREAMLHPVARRASFTWNGEEI